MGLFDNFRRKSFPQPFILQDMTRIPYTQLTASDQSFIQNGYESNADLFAVINLMTSNAANLTPELYDTSGKEEKEILKHELLDLMRQPMPGMTYRRWIAQVGGYFWVTGNAYIWKPVLDVGVNRGKTTQLVILPSQFVSVKATPNGPEYSINAGSWKKTFVEGEILHIRTPNLGYGSGSELKGMSPLQPAINNVSASNEGTKSQDRRFKNGGADGILGVKDAKTAEQVKDLAADLKSRQGSDNAGRIMVASSDLAFVRFGMSPADLEILKTVSWNRTVFCNIYGIDPHLVDPSVGSTYNNMREAVASLYNRAIIPFMDELYNGLNNWLVPAYGKSLRLDADDSQVAELQKDKKENVTWLSQAWWLTGNEKRREIDYEPIKDPEMDLIQYPTNLQPFGAADEAERQLGKRGAPDYRT